MDSYLTYSQYNRQPTLFTINAIVFSNINRFKLFQVHENKKNQSKKNIHFLVCRHAGFGDILLS